MKTKFFVIVICMSFVLLIAASGTILEQKGMCQWSGIGSTQLSSPSIGGIVAGALLNLSGYGSQGHIVSGVLAHRFGYTSTYPPGQNDLYSSWGMQTADYYFHDFFLNPLIGLGDYMQGLQFGGVGSSVATSGFPASYYNYDYSSNWTLDPRLPHYIKDVIPEKKIRPIQPSPLPPIPKYPPSPWPFPQVPWESYL